MTTEISSYFSCRNVDNNIAISIKSSNNNLSIIHSENFYTFKHPLSYSASAYIREGFVKKLVKRLNELKEKMIKFHLLKLHVAVAHTKPQ